MRRQKQSCGTRESANNGPVVKLVYALRLERSSFGIVSSSLTGATLDSRRTLSSPDSGRNGDRDPGPAHTGDSESASSGGLAQW